MAHDPATTRLLSQTRALRSLLSAFSAALASTTARAAALPPSPPNPLDVLRDAAQLLRAQTTKLGLLLVSAPFAPSAAATVLAACEAEAVPGLAGAWEVLRAGRACWGELLVAEVRGAAEGLARAFGELLERCEGVAERGKGGEGEEKSRKEVMEATGRVWERCDALVGVATAGFAGVLVAKVEAWRELVRDAVEELREWADDDEEDDDGGEDERARSDADSLEDLFSAKKMPKDRQDVRELLDRAVKKLRLVTTFYQAVVKRRFKTFPFEPPPHNDSVQREAATARIKTVDEACSTLKEVPDKVDELAGAFYDLDCDRAEALLQSILSDVKETALKVSPTWDGQEDAFTTWVQKWKDAITSTQDNGEGSTNGVLK